MVRIQNAAAVANLVPEIWTETQMGLEMRPSEHSDPAVDVLIAEVQGQPVAWGQVRWYDTNDSLREYRSGGDVHPDWRRKGIGTRLLAANLARIGQLAAEQETALPRVIGAWAADQNPGAHALLERHAFAPVRWFFTMRRPLDEPIPDLPLPDGLEVRPVTHDDARRLFAADHEAFLDHWGAIDASEHAFQGWVEDPVFDPSMFVVGFDGDEVAGAVFNAIYPEENATYHQNRGWLDSVFVRRPWRRRGLGQSLVARSLVVLRERGLDEAMLGVDADNPNGALGLYTGVGFVTDQRFTAYRRPLELDPK